MSFVDHHRPKAAGAASNKAAVFGITLLSLSPLAQAADLRCNLGPAAKSFGGAAWLAYACDDGRSLVLITPRESKAYPFVFTLYSSGAGQPYQIHGEGTGDKAVTDRTAAELKALKDPEISQLRSEAANGKN